MIEGVNRMDNIYRYTLKYYLPNQSRLFSNPQTYTTYDKDDMKRVLKVASQNNYEVVSLIKQKKEGK